MAAGPLQCSGHSRTAEPCGKAAPHCSPLGCVLSGHLFYKFGITESDWYRIKQSIDSKCRTAWRRKQRGQSLAVKSFSRRTPSSSSYSASGRPCGRRCEWSFGAQCRGRPPTGRVCSGPQDPSLWSLRVSVARLFGERSSPVLLPHQGTPWPSGSESLWALEQREGLLGPSSPAAVDS